MDTLTLATFDQSHLSGAHRLSREAGWPHRREDWAMLLSLSRGAVILDGGTVIATALATPAGPVALANMIIVDAGRRGGGLGRRVMEAAMGQVSAEEWRLVATSDGLPLYERMGFTAQGEIFQHQGIVQPMRRDLPLPPLAGPTDIQALAEIDRAATGMERPGLLAALLRDGRVYLLRERGRIVAFAAQRLFGRGIVIGPVIARDGAEAMDLVEPLLAAAEGQFVRIDVDGDRDFAAWVASRGLARAGGGVKMRRGAPSEPPGPQRRLAFAAQSLG